jgi:thiosulfate/3-mercaptopyruvate sulfurtransferase
MVHAECTACNNPTAQQDVLNSELAVFLGKADTVKDAISSTNGLVNPRYSRQNTPQSAANTDTESEKEILNVKNLADLNGSSSNEAAHSSKKRSPSFSSMLASFDSINDSDIILDISPNATEYIPGAINIPYTNFLERSGVLRPVSEIAKVLGNAGISQDDPVKVTGKCPTCGGGKSASTSAYSALKYVGHKNVKLLDGGIDDWVDESRPTVTKAAVLPPKNYTPTTNANIMATYEYIHSIKPQIIDARTKEDFEAESIPGAINIPYENVLDGEEIKDEASLKELFSTLDKNRPVVVYTNAGVKASAVWFVLSMMGYDARLYTLQDWIVNQPVLNISIKETSAQPNPAKIGDVVQITVVFEDNYQSQDSVPKTANNDSNESILTIRGCATCGFGSAQGYANLDSSGGMVKIGSTSKNQKSAAENDFKVYAIVLSAGGESVSKVVMKRISGDRFSGIWNANVASGVYKVDFVASLEDITKTFKDALEIEIAATSKYKKLGN